MEYIYQLDIKDRERKIYIFDEVAHNFYQCYHFQTYVIFQFSFLQLWPCGRKMWLSKTFGSPILKLKWRPCKYIYICEKWRSLYF